MNPRALGSTIAQRRKLLGLGQQALADIAGVSRHGLINIETGKGNPTLTTLNALADSLGLELRLTLKNTKAPEGG